MEAKSIARLELIQVAEAVSREKSIEKEEVIVAMEEAILVECGGRSRPRRPGERRGARRRRDALRYRPNVSSRGRSSACPSCFSLQARRVTYGRAAPSS